MLLTLTFILVFSSLAMGGLLYAKHWELTTGKLLFSGVRPRVTRTSARVLGAIEYRLPLICRRVARIGAYWLRMTAKDIVARILITVEHTLEAVLYNLKHGFAARKEASGQASSAFLREVAEHKRKLTRVTRLRRMPAQDIAEHSEAQ